MSNGGKKPNTNGHNNHIQYKLVSKFVVDIENASSTIANRWSKRKGINKIWERKNCGLLKGFKDRKDTHIERDRMWEKWRFRRHSVTWISTSLVTSFIQFSLDFCHQHRFNPCVRHPSCVCCVCAFFFLLELWPRIFFF